MEFDVENYLSNISYINKDVYSIWQEIQETVPKLTNKWVPSEANESDPLVVLLKELAIIADKVNYNTDKNILELFPDLVTQLRTAYSVFESMGYNPQWYKSALSTISVNYNGGIGDTAFSDVSTLIQFKIPRFTQVSDQDSTIIYTLLDELRYTTGTPAQSSALAVEGSINDLIINGSNLIKLDNLDERNRIYFVQPNVAQNGIFVSSYSDFSDIIVDTSESSSSDISDTANTSWKLVNNLAPYVANSKIYKFGIDPSTGSNYLEFPQDIGNIIGEGLYIKYILSSGEAGNIKRNTLSKFFSEPDIISGSEDDVGISTSNFIITNSTTSQSGRDPETIAEMQKNYSRVVGTFDTLVTLRDYENYIYNYTKPYTGAPVVSNIRVSDLTNDLEQSLKFQNLSAQGVNSTFTISNAALTSFDLKYHALTPVQDIIDKNSFDTTFTLAGNNAFASVINSTQDAKIINHRVSKVNAPLILVPYDISGQIYLHKSVPETEAREIKNNVDLAIYQAVNARKLLFGSAINYTDLLNVITSADSRIQYVALNPIQYYNNGSNPIVEIRDDGSKDRIENFRVTINAGSDYTVEQLAVMAGTQPWTEYSPFIFNYNQQRPINNYHGNSSDATKNAYITNIKPYVSLGNGAYDEFTVGTNETFSIITPLYNPETTYSNYLYYITNIKNDIPKDTLYELQGDEEIRFYDERPTSATITPIETLKASTIIQSNTDIKGNSTEYVNMGSKINISTMKLASNYLLTSTPNSEVRIGTNSAGLDEFLRDEDNRLGSGNASFTLGLGEYLIYSDNNNLELGILGEGTTISTTGNSLGDYTGSYLITGEDVKSASNGTVPSNLHAITNSYALGYRLNNIYSFGSGYKLTASTAGEEVPIIPAESNQKIKEGVVFDIGTDVQINYSLNNETTGTILANNINSLPYQGLLNLQLIIGPDREQLLNSRQVVDIEITTSPLGSSSSSTETTTITGSEPPTQVQSSSYILYPGGAGLKILQEEAESLDIMSVIVNGNVVGASTSTMFTPISSLSSPITVPGSAEDLFVIATNDDNTVHYWLVRGGASLVFGNGGTAGLSEEKNISRPYLITGDLPDGVSLGSGDTIAPISLGDINYNILYQPSEEEYIEDSLSPDSFFRSNHVLNRYVLPKLNSLVDLKISPLSIRGGGNINAS